MRPVICLMFLVLAGDANPQPLELDKLLDEQIAISEKFAADESEYGDDSPYSKMLEKYEVAHEKAWIDLLNHVRRSDDRRMKILMLRVDYTAAASGEVIDLEFAETLAEKAKPLASIARHDKRLAELDALLQTTDRAEPATDQSP